MAVVTNDMASEYDLLRHITLLLREQILSNKIYLLLPAVQHGD